MQTNQQVVILGATGSIGVSTLKVIGLHPDRFSVFAISGHSQLELLVNQALAFAPRYIVLTDASKYQELQDMLALANCYSELVVGAQALNDICAHPEVDTVMSAIVGAAGLAPTLAAVRAGKRVLLANTEALVMSGELFMQEVRKHKAQLLPIDSEHNAIFQCLPPDYRYAQLTSSGISHLLLTGSGGPFLRTPLEDFAKITADQACAHPNWDMGRKISVDSATMMNKGLEFIEAKWLFGVDESKIEVVIHPQSTIHSMVQYIDGSVIAQLGNPDMCTPIAYGLSYPERIDAGVANLDFASLRDFSFSTACKTRYPNLYLAIDACKHGQTATTALNASNEIAVDAFLQGQVSFTDIHSLNAQVLDSIDLPILASIDEIMAFDAQVRVKTQSILESYRC